jgi:solute carrier family 25 carnitine/acylcarnitine transporter 20/29
MDLHYAPFVAGVLAGANGTFVGHPFDTLKTRFQVGRTLNHKLDLFFVRQLYRGILPPLMTSGAIQSVNFFMFENFRSRIQRSDIPETGLGKWVKSDLGAIFVAGSLSGAVVSLVGNPISIVKIRQQVESSAGVGQCVREIYASCGWRGFYRGYSTMLALDGTRGLYLTIYEVMKRAVVSVGGSISDLDSLPLQATNFLRGTDGARRGGDIVPIASTTSTSEPYFTHTSTPTRMLAAALTGMVCWAIIYPLDVVRVRLHLDFANTKYTNWRDCCAKTYAEGGLRTFYRGLGYTMVRAGPVSAASLTTYEYTKELFERMER